MNYCQSFCRTIKRLGHSRGGLSDSVLVLPLNGSLDDISGNHYNPTTTGAISYVTGYLQNTQAVKITNSGFVYYDNILSIPGDFSLDFFANYYTSIHELYWGYYWLHPSTSAWRQYSGLGVSTQLREGVVGKYPNVSINPITLNTWYHIAVTREGGVIRMFENGTLAGSGTPADKDAGLRFDIGYTNFSDSRITYYQNIKLTNTVRHIVTNGVYTFPVPTALYTN